MAAWNDGTMIYSYEIRGIQILEVNQPGKGSCRILRQNPR